MLIPTWFAAGVSRMGLLALSALWMPALQVFQMTVIEQHWRSLAYGAVSTAMGFAFGTVSLAGGFIAASMGYSALFLLGSVMAASGALVMWGLRRYLNGQCSQRGRNARVRAGGRPRRTEASGRP